MKKFWEVQNVADNTGELYIYGEITPHKWDDTDTTAQSFKEDLEALGDIKMLNVYINSPGGSVFQGQAIYSILKRQKAQVNIHIDGLAASIASVVAMAGDTIFMPKNAMMMVHNPWMLAIGNAQDLRKMADDLDKIRESIIEAYLSKAGSRLSLEKISELMDNETWLTAQECADYGLCDEVVEAKGIAASIADTELFHRYKNTPKELLEALQSAKKSGLSQEERQKLIVESKKNIEQIDKLIGGL
ncbi:ATP-dependent Clp protease protease subunit [Planifilum fimeticola]|uniref:ATP-dependent Clp protease proteolytic subunit n=1 Tax=Planifilum fimeticola TaxID=201975 RepID=A0A2T0LC11_9BACL|nr:head maturation protease, ClpP-related [Planifilum fimeticola]PRX39515.1 ATP-dependent Clp protease protease subunit [Planifilum fimeticola]